MIVVEKLTKQFKGQVVLNGIDLAHIDLALTDVLDLKGFNLNVFGGYEYTKEQSPNSRTATVPTELQRQGDFSQSVDNNGNPWVKSLLVWGGIFLALLLVVSMFGGPREAAGTARRGRRSAGGLAPAPRSALRRRTTRAGTPRRGGRCSR